MPRATEVAKKATFTRDDKRAQYARLVVVNYGHQEGLIPKGTDVNSATNAQIEKAGKALNHGNILDGPGGIEILQGLSKAGADNEKVAKRGLTKAYAQEVRPFIRRLEFAPSFGRRGRKAAPKPAAAAGKKSGKKGSGPRKQAAAAAPAPTESES